MPAPRPASLAVEFCGLKLASPIVLLSGCVGFGEEYTRVEGFSNTDVGAIVLKGTTREPRLGNPPHRVYETPMGMLNAIGLQNPGVDVVVDRILPTLDFGETRFFANVCGSTIEDYVETTRRFEDSPIDAIEINISCPNIKEGGVQFGNVPEMSARVVAACRAVTRKPLITKLSPNQTDIKENARRCIEAGSDALAVINTVMGMAIDVKTRKPVIGNIQGGLSGPAIKPIALLKVMQVAEVARPLGVPIIGQGGIYTAEDALEFIIAGATTVGVGTSLFYDPLVCRKINAGIADYLAQNRMASVAELDHDDAEGVPEVTQRASAEIRQLPSIDLLHKGKHLRHASRDGAYYLVLSFSGIYLLCLVFDGEFDELRAERAAHESLPRIERLVLALFLLDPDPQPVGGVAALRRPRRR